MLFPTMFAINRAVVAIVSRFEEVFSKFSVRYYGKMTSKHLHKAPDCLHQ